MCTSTVTSPGVLKSVVDFFVGSNPAEGPSYESCLPETCSAYCCLADSTLTSLQEMIVSGTVTLQQIKNLSSTSKKLQVERLCAVNQEKYSLEVIRSSLVQRTAEYTAFREYKNMLAVICHDVESVKLQVEGAYYFMQVVHTNRGSPANFICM